MNKAQKIVELRKTKSWNNATIAAVVGCGESYVRTALQRHAGSRSDSKWRRANRDKWLDMRREQNRRYYAKRKSEATK